MAEPVTTLSLMTMLYLTGIAQIPTERMTYIDPMTPSPSALFVPVGNPFNCFAAPANCKTGLPATQRCKRTTAGQKPGILWITCSVEGYPTLWKATAVACTCST